MNASQDPMGGLGRNNTLPLPKGADNRNSILMIWLLYLFILSDDFWENKRILVPFYPKLKKAYILILLQVGNNTIQETMTSGVTRCESTHIHFGKLLFQVKSHIFFFIYKTCMTTSLLILQYYSQITIKVTFLAQCLLPINGTITIFLYINV